MQRAKAAMLVLTLTLHQLIHINLPFTVKSCNLNWQLSKSVPRKAKAECVLAHNVIFWEGLYELVVIRLIAAT